MRIKKIRLANGLTFSTRNNYRDTYVSDINEREQSITLTFKRGAQSFRRTFAKWYVEKLTAKGVAA